MSIRSSLAMPPKKAAGDLKRERKDHDLKRRLGVPARWVKKLALERRGSAEEKQALKVALSAYETKTREDEDGSHAEQIKDELSKEVNRLHELLSEREKPVVQRREKEFVELGGLEQELPPASPSSVFSLPDASSDLEKDAEFVPLPPPLKRRVVRISSAAKSSKKKKITQEEEEVCPVSSVFIEITWDGEGNSWGGLFVEGSQTPTVVRYAKAWPVSTSVSSLMFAFVSQMNEQEDVRCLHFPDKAFEVRHIIPKNKKVSRTLFCAVHNVMQEGEGLSTTLHKNRPTKWRSLTHRLTGRSWYCGQAPTKEHEVGDMVSFWLHRPGAEAVRMPRGENAFDFAKKHNMLHEEEAEPGVLDLEKHMGMSIRCKVEHPPNLLCCNRGYPRGGDHRNCVYGGWVERGRVEGGHRFGPALRGVAFIGSTKRYFGEPDPYFGRSYWPKHKPKVSPSCPLHISLEERVFGSREYQQWRAANEEDFYKNGKEAGIEFFHGECVCAPHRTSGRFPKEFVRCSFCGPRVRTPLDIRREHKFAKFCEEVLDPPEPAEFAGDLTDGHKILEASVQRGERVRRLHERFAAHEAFCDRAEKAGVQVFWGSSQKQVS